MKKNILIVVLLLLVGLLAYAAFFRGDARGRLGPEVAPPIEPGKSRVEVGFDFGRQGGFASNQFAVWIADADGQLVKTLFVTDFTAGKGGWEYRKESIPQWVAASGIGGMTKEKVDAVTGATPPSSPLRYVWYGDGSDGRPVVPGVYTVMVEATLRGENQVLYRAEIDLSGEAAEVKPAPEFKGDGTAERGMLTNVVVRWLPAADEGM